MYHNTELSHYKKQAGLLGQRQEGLRQCHSLWVDSRHLCEPPCRRLLPTRGAPEPAWGHSSGQVCPQTTPSAPVCCRRAVNWAVPIPATLFWHKPGSYTHEVRWDGHNFSQPQKPCTQRYLVSGLWQGEFQQARLEIMGFSHIRATKSQCQRWCIACLLMLLCHGLGQGGGKHWEAGN